MFRRLYSCKILFDFSFCRRQNEKQSKKAGSRNAKKKSGGTAKKPKAASTQRKGKGGSSGRKRR